MNTFRNLLNSVVGDVIGTRKKTVGLLFSGGVDSLSCGFAANDLGHDVVAYTFKVEGIPSIDASNAQICCDALGWEFKLFEVPVENIIEDFIKLYSVWKCVKKTQFECTWPFLYLVPVIKEKFVLSGIAADGHYGLSKKAMIHFKEPKEKFDEFRINYFTQDNPAGQLQQFDLLKAYDHIQVAPYLDQLIFDYFIKFDWYQINKPREKEIILKAYSEYFDKVPIRRHANLQIVGGVREVFESLLTSELNTKNRVRVMDLCRDYAGYDPLDVSKHKKLKQYTFK